MILFFMSKFVFAFLVFGGKCKLADAGGLDSYLLLRPSTGIWQACTLSMTPKRISFSFTYLCMQVVIFGFLRYLSHDYDMRNLIISVLPDSIDNSKITWQTITYIGNNLLKDVQAIGNIMHATILYVF